jgi:hypothetical protein
MASHSNEVDARLSPKSEIEALEQEIAGTRVRLSTSLAALEGEASRLLTPTPTGRVVPSEPRDLIALSASVMRTIAKLRDLKRSGQLKQAGLSVAGFSVAVALLRVARGRAAR